MIAALTLTLVAGLATALGGALGIVGRGNNPRVLAAALALAAGVMLTVSGLEVLPAAIQDAGLVGPVLAAASGAVLVLGADALASWAIRRRSRRRALASAAVTAPGADSPLVGHDAVPHRSHVATTGILAAVVLAAHNAPEGFVTFVSALEDPVLALPIVAAIAIHNIPEGLAVAVPIYHATGSRTKAMAAATAAGMAEPLGALGLYGLLGAADLLHELALVNAAVAGIMITISLRALLPLAIRLEGWRLAALWLAAGGLVMGISLWALG